ncbi:response regulator transcription factor [Streptomyces sp. NPDC046909]|uniref:response regulator transcription factor n=1 Tax=Streptomyces sp. NPDC046909 TaxID=3155617 RepID=UPI0033DA7986
MRVLIAEGERTLADAVAEGLRRAAFAVDLVHDGAAALERIEVHGYDVVVLDRGLPGVRGDAVCRAIVASRSTARVLMVSAAATVDDRVEGLALGADDCLPKPFALAELTARVHALARRARPAAPPVLERSDLRLDPARREVFREGNQVRLANKEFAVLTELLLAEGAVVSAEQLLEKAWDENTDPFTNTVRVTVMKLRKKLGQPQVVETVSGAGYRVR